MNPDGNTCSIDLDAGTTRLLDSLAARWGVSRERAVKRALAEIETNKVDSEQDLRIRAFKELQQTLQLTAEQAAEWQSRVRDARR